MAGPELDKWMYPFEFGTGGTRAFAPTFASFDPRFDTRDAEFLIGWDTQGQFGVPTNLPPSRYLVGTVQVTLENAVLPGLPPFVYDPSHDSYRTYLSTNDPLYMPDTDDGRPIELYGAGFRGGFTAATYLEGSPFGPLGSFTSSNISIGTRNSFAAQFDTNGVLVDIANNVGQRNAAWTNAPFEATPWAVGRAVSPDLSPGQFVPDGAGFRFDIDTADPAIVGYIQRALALGKLRFMVSSLSPATQVTPGGTGFGGQGRYPQWATRDNPGLLYSAPSLTLTVAAVTDTDSDGDGLPDEWERFHFGQLGTTTGTADPDGDGMDNRSEYLAGTDPDNAADVLRAVLMSAGPRPSLRFRYAASRRYRIERSGDLGAWTGVGGGITYPATGVALWFATEDVAGTAFLRVRCEME